MIVIVRTYRITFGGVWVCFLWYLLFIFFTAIPVWKSGQAPLLQWLHQQRADFVLQLWQWEVHSITGWWFVILFNLSDLSVGFSFFFSHSEDISFLELLWLDPPLSLLTLGQKWLKGNADCSIQHVIPLSLLLCLWSTMMKQCDVKDAMCQCPQV